MAIEQDNRDAIDSLVDYFVSEAEWSVQDARDAVIIAWLNAGDMAPYLHFVSQGHAPSNKVARVVARMMIKGDDPKADGFEDVKFGLELTGDKRLLPDQLGDLRLFLAVRNSMILQRQRKKTSGRRAYSGAADDEAAEAASNVCLAKRSISGRTVRRERERVERDLAAGRFPKILSGLISLK